MQSPYTPGQYLAMTDSLQFWIVPGDCQWKITDGECKIHKNGTQNEKTIDLYQFEPFIKENNYFPVVAEVQKSIDRLMKSQREPCGSICCIKPEEYLDFEPPVRHPQGATISV